MISWEEAKDPEEETVQYSIFLDDKLVIDNITELSYDMSNLKASTAYNGYVLATDESGNTTQSDFSFQTTLFLFNTIVEYPNSSIVGNSLLKDTDNGYIIGGTIYSSGVNNFLLIKLDKDGNELFHRIYNYTPGRTQYYNTDSKNTVLKKVTNGYLFFSFNIVIKLDENFDEQWVTYLQCEDANSCAINDIIETNDGQFMAVGTYEYPASIASQTNTAEQIYINKIDNSGSILWSKLLGESVFNRAASCVKLSNNSYVLLGSKETSGATWGDIYSGGPPSFSLNFCLINFDANGDPLWEKTYRNVSFPQKLIKTNDNGLVLIGHGWYQYQGTYSTLSTISTIKTGINGDLIWDHTEENIGVASNTSIFEVTDGSYVSTGTFNFSNFNNNMYLFARKFDINGNRESSMLYDFDLENPDIEDTQGVDAIQTEDGGYVILGNQGFNKIILFNTTSSFTRL